MRMAHVVGRNRYIALMASCDEVGFGRYSRVQLCSRIAHPNINVQQFRMPSVFVMGCANILRLSDLTATPTLDFEPL